MDKSLAEKMNDSANVPLDIMIASSGMLQSSGSYEDFMKKKITTEENAYNALKCFNNFNQKCMIEQNLNFCENDHNFISVNCKDDINVIRSNETNMKSLTALSTASILESDINAQTEQNQLKATDSGFEATDDESMAVEALRQLGGIYDDNLTSGQVFSVLTCGDKIQASAELCTPATACKSTQLLQVQVCPICRKSFDSEQEFQQHDCRAAQEKYVCNICSSSFFAKNDLQKHVSFSHPGTHRCNICNGTFHRPSSLTNHMKIHNYQPGRAISTPLNQKQAERVVEPTMDNVWSVEQAFISDVTESTVASDALSSWNFNYNTVSQIIQSDVSQEVTSLEQEISNNFGQDASSNALEDVSKSLDGCPADYEAPVKVESLPYACEKSIDGSFPMLSLPQVEVTDAVRPFTCAHCGLSFARLKALVSHKKLHAFNWAGAHECSGCGEVFPKQALREQHGKSCAGEQPLLAASAEPAAGKDEAGRKPAAKVGRHACPDCDKRFATKQKMYRHMWIHRKKVFTCELCALTFKVQAELDKHRLSQHPADSPYVCQECGKSFASRQGLWEHGRVHGGGPAGLFRCAECGKTFTSRQGYLIHNRTHTGERPYGCRFCLKAFRDGGTLRKHERIHTGERPHVCPICMHDFNQKVVLREHVRWVHAANRAGNDAGLFDCQLCSVAVADKEELCAHIVKHSDLMAAEAKDSGDKPARKARPGGAAPQPGPAPAPAPALPPPDAARKPAGALPLIDADFDIKPFDFSPDVLCAECDMCGQKFSSQKELMTHVQIHI